MSSEPRNNSSPGSGSTEGSAEGSQRGEQEVSSPPDNIGLGIHIPASETPASLSPWATTTPVDRPGTNSEPSQAGDTRDGIVESPVVAHALQTEDESNASLDTHSQGQDNPNSPEVGLPPNVIARDMLFYEERTMTQDDENAATDFAKQQWDQWKLEKTGDGEDETLKNMQKADQDEGNKFDTSDSEDSSPYIWESQAWDVSSSTAPGDDESAADKHEEEPPSDPQSTKAEHPAAGVESQVAGSKMAPDDSTKAATNQPFQPSRSKSGSMFYLGGDDSGSDGEDEEGSLV